MKNFMQQKIINILTFILGIISVAFIVWILIQASDVRAVTVSASVPSNPCNECLKYCQ
jgi:hypothetical protein